MDAAEDFAALLHAVPNNPTVAMRANRREGMNRALETVEGVVLSGHNHFECLVILIFTNFACSHT
jgi:hypothetical protein